jgi:hypothetical protein
MPTATFAPGSATATVTIDPTADATVESDETVSLTLAAGTGYIIGTAGAVTGTITNDDGSPPPPPISDTYIPLTWNDPVFANVVETTSALSPSSGQSVSDRSIVLSGSGVAIFTDGPVTLDRIRARSREGYRGGRGEQYLSNMYIEVYGLSDDHADALQMYNPGNNGRVTLKNSTFRVDGTPGTPNAAYFTANDWMGAHVLENVLLSGGGFTLRIHGDGGTSMSLKNVYIEETGTQYLGPHSFPQVNGVRPAIVRWENVRWASTVNGQLVLGDLIPQQYGAVRDYTGATYGTRATTEAFTLGANGGRTYVGDSGSKTYTLTSYTDSLIASPCWVTDFKIGIDTLNGPNSTSITPVVLATKASAFTSAAVGALLNNTTVFPASGASIFKVGAMDGERVFLALNSGSSAFSATEDSIIEITGYSGHLAQLRVT